MRVIGYIRVSTDGQAKDGFGMDAQRDQIERYCAERGHEIIEFVVDDGFSGATTNRPGLNRILDGDILNPPVEAIVAAANDRFARGVEQYFYLKYKLKTKEKGNPIELISVKEDFGQMGVLAPVLESLVASMAQLERERIKERTMSGKQAKKRSGEYYVGGYAPYGYKAVDGHLEINETEAEAIRMIFRLHKQGNSQHEICRRLDAAGYATRKGNAWNQSTLHFILEAAPAYRGYIRMNGLRGYDAEWREGNHEPILTEDEWSIQNFFSEQKRRESAKNGNCGGR